jgi:hypothetical protein
MDKQFSSVLLAFAFIIGLISLIVSLMSQGPGGDNANNVDITKSRFSIIFLLPTNLLTKLLGMVN